MNVLPPRIASLCVAPDATIREAMGAVEDGGHTVCLVIEGADHRLSGLLTDGDLRRGLLAGTGLDDPVAPLVQRQPLTVTPADSRAHVLDVMRAHGVWHLPVLDGGRLVGLHTQAAVVGRPTVPNSAVVVAGGRGTRLGDLTRHVPKALMNVAGRPVIEWIILELVGSGIEDVWVSVGHLADQIIDRLGAGEALGCRIRYLHDPVDTPMGTAGALSLLHAQLPDLAHPVVVVNGDLMVRFRADALLAAHRESGAVVTVGKKKYSHQVPFGVVEEDAEGRLVQLVEKPEILVDVVAGIYAVDPSVVHAVPARSSVTMPGVVGRCLQAGQRVGTWVLEDEWIDIGTPRELARAMGG